MIILPLFYCLVNAFAIEFAIEFAIGFAIHSGGNYCCNSIVIVLLLPPIHAPGHPARLSKTYFFLVLPPFRTPTPWVRYSAAASFLLYLLCRHRCLVRGIPRRLLACFASCAGLKAMGEVFCGGFFLALPPGQAPRPWARYSTAASFLFCLLCRHQGSGRGILRRLLSCFTSCAGT